MSDTFFYEKFLYRVALMGGLIKKTLMAIDRKEKASCYDLVRVKYNIGTSYPTITGRVSFDVTSKGRLMVSFTDLWGEKGCSIVCLNSVYLWFDEKQARLFRWWL